MRRLNRALFRAFLWSFITYGLCGCVHKEQHQLDVVQAEHDQLAATEHLHVDAEQHDKLTEHQLVTTGPGETVEEDFAPQPDGGVLLAKRVTTSWGEKKQENWLKESLAAEQHLDVDAGVVQTHDATATVRESSASDTHASAGCMLGLGFWGAIALCVLLGAAALYLRVKGL